MTGEAMSHLLAETAKPRGVSLSGNLARLGRRLMHPIASYIDLEAFERTSGLRGLHARVLDQHLSTLAHHPQPLQQRRRQRKRHEPLGRLQGTERTETTLMATPPRPFVLFPGPLPFVELSLPDPPPALETAHRSDLLVHVIITIIIESAGLVKSQQDLLERTRGS